MSENSLTLKIWSFDSEILSKEIISLKVECVDGWVEILKGHAPYVGVLKKSVVEIVDSKNKKITLNLPPGIIKVEKNLVSLFVQSNICVLKS